MITTYIILAVLHLLAFALMISTYARGKRELAIGLLGSAIVAVFWPIPWLDAGYNWLISHL